MMATVFICLFCKACCLLQSYNVTCAIMDNQGLKKGDKLVAKARKIEH